MKIKTVLRAALFSALVLPFAVPTASSQEWPSKPIRWIVPFAPGGGTDASARILQEPVSKILGQPIVIENKPGGAGTIGTELAVRAPADGYTFAIIFTSHSANPSLLEKVPYDSEKEITPIAFFWRSWPVFSVLTTSPIKSLKDLIEVSKQKPGSISYGTGGVGQATHLATAAFAQQAGIQMTHAPYSGGALALNDLLAGHLPMLISSQPVVEPHIKTGKVRSIAVTGPQRLAALADVPTVAESGFPGFSVSEWTGFIGPANLPPSITQKMNAAIRQALKDPQVASRLAQMGFETVDQSSADFAKFLKEDATLMAKVIKDGNIKP